MYLRLGILARMALIHGGGSLNVFSESVFKFICGVDPTDLTPTIDEVPDTETRNILEHVKYYVYFSFT